jgi:hypothetical protein
MTPCMSGVAIDLGLEFGDTGYRCLQEVSLCKSRTGSVMGAVPKQLYMDLKIGS